MGINWEQNGIILSSAFKLLYSLRTSGIPTFFSCHLGYLNTFIPSFSAAWAKGSAFPYKKYFALQENLKQLNGTNYSRVDKIIICGKQPLKIWRDMVCLSRPYPFKFFKTVFHKFYLVHSWILCPKCFYAYHSLHSPFLLGKVKPPTKFSGRGGLRRPSFLEGVTGKEVGGLFEMGGGCNFYIKNNQFNGSKKCIFGNVITFKKFRERKFRETKTCSKL